MDMRRSDRSDQGSRDSRSTNRRGRHRGWCFTDNRTDLGGPTFNPSHVQYAIWQRERGGRTGHTHFQGYVYFKNTVSFKVAKENIGVHCHIEPALGSLAQNIDYCSKEDTRCEEEDSGPWFFGEYTEEDLDATRTAVQRRGGGAKKSTLDQWGERAKHAGGIKHIIDNHPGIYIRHWQGLTRLRALSIQPRRSDVNPHVEVRHGPSGAGKSRSVYTEFSHSEVYSKDGSRWWDYYDGEPVVLFDDFTGDAREIPPVQLLRILDRYPIRVQTKGGYVQLSQSKFILTSSIHHHEWYGGSEEWHAQLQAFERRVTRWRQFPETNTAATEQFYDVSHPRVERDPYTGQIY